MQLSYRWPLHCQISIIVTLVAITTIKDEDKDHLVLASAVDRQDLGGSRIRGKLDSLSLPFSFFPPRQLLACLFLSSLSESLEQTKLQGAYAPRPNSCHLFGECHGLSSSVWFQDTEKDRLQIKRSFFFLKLFCSNCVASECHTRRALASHARVSRLSPTSCFQSRSVPFVCLSTRTLIRKNTHFLQSRRKRHVCNRW